MAKVRYKKRIMPRDGRVVKGAYKSNYSDGVDHALLDRLRAIRGDVLLTPVCKTARPRSFWDGYRRANGDTKQKAADVGNARTAQMRLMIDLFAEQGMDLRSYLLSGGTMAEAMAVVMARGTENRPVGGRPSGRETARA